MNVSNFKERAVGHHREVRSNYLKQDVSAGRKAARTKMLRVEAESVLPAPLLRAVKSKYGTRQVRMCNAAHLAHLTRGTYDRWLAAFDV